MLIIPAMFWAFVMLQFEIFLLPLCIVAGIAIAVQCWKSEQHIISYTVLILCPFVGFSLMYGIQQALRS